MSFTPPKPPVPGGILEYMLRRDQDLKEGSYVRRSIRRSTQVINRSPDVCEDCGATAVRAFNQGARKMELSCTCGWRKLLPKRSLKASK